MIWRINKTRSIIVVLIFFVLIYILTSIFPNTVTTTTNNEESGITVPIIMYHSVFSGGGSNDFTVTPSLFLKDMEYIKSNGYTAITVLELIEYVNSDAPLPDKPIIITLDDGYLNNQLHVLPVLEELDLVAVISVIGSLTDEFTNSLDKNPLYAHMTWEDINTVHDSGRVEIGNHTYDMHGLKNRKGCMKKSSENTAEYEAILKADLSKLQEKLESNSDITPYIFTYPYGFVSPESIPVIKELGFKAALTCAEKINLIDKNPDNLYDLGRINRVPNMSSEAFFSSLKKYPYHCT